MCIHVRFGCIQCLLDIAAYANVSKSSDSRYTFLYYSIILMGFATGFKWGGTIIELESEPKCNVNLTIYKII